MLYFIYFYFFVISFWRNEKQFVEGRQREGVRVFGGIYIGVGQGVEEESGVLRQFLGAGDFIRRYEFRVFEGFECYSVIRSDYQVSNVVVVEGKAELVFWRELQRFGEEERICQNGGFVFEMG